MERICGKRVTEKFGRPSCSAYIQAVDFTRHMQNVDPSSFGHLKFKFKINAKKNKKNNKKQKKLQVAAETLQLHVCVVQVLAQRSGRDNRDRS